jgi:hypothetical protein
MRLLALFMPILLFGDIEIDFQEREDDEVVYKQIISFELGGGTIQRPKADTLAQESSISRDFYSAGVKIGAEDIGLRLFLSYRPLLIEEEDETILTHSFGLELDSLIDLNERIRLFYGLVGGGIAYEIEDKNSSIEYSKTITPYYGLNLGAIFDLAEHFEFEVGGRFAITNINSSELDSSYIFDNVLNYYIGLNYKY